ncbi:HAD hydrolase-like protein [Xanthobacteraceae bacterium A53D]
MAYKLVMFDFDGTLADSAGWFLGTLDDVSARFGFRRPADDEIEQLRGRSSREVLRTLRIPLWKLPFIARHMHVLAREAADQIQLFPGVGELLAGLKSDGRTTAIVTSNSETTVRRILGPELAPLIDHYECGAAMFGKAPRIKRLLRHTGVEAHEAIMIGDETRDQDAATGASVDFAAVLWGYARPEAFTSQGAALTVETVEALGLRLAGRG